MDKASLIARAVDIVTPRLKRLEGLHDGDTGTPVLEPMMCPVGVWTVGYGHALTDADGRQLRGATARSAALQLWRSRWPKGMTRGDADVLLAVDARHMIEQVLALLTKPTVVSPNELGAMSMLAYNIGVANFAGSSVLKAHNAGDREAAARAFGLWIKGTVNNRKVTLPGLVTRREEEATLYAGGGAAVAPPAIAPQAVEVAGMKPLQESRTIKAAQLGGGLAAVTTITTQVGPVVEQVKAVGENIRAVTDLLPLPSVSLNPGWAVAGILALVLAYVVWRRIDDHRQHGA